MLVPERPLPTFTGGVCGYCRRPPLHDADIAAQALGYAWETRNPLPGLEPAFFVCAACAHAQAHETHAEAAAAGYSRPPLTCCRS
jgi:hypothetical protein